MMERMVSTPPKPHKDEPKRLKPSKPGDSLVAAVEEALEQSYARGMLEIERGQRPEKVEKPTSRNAEKGKPLHRGA
jgi:hypothetical protein